MTYLIDFDTLNNLTNIPDKAVPMVQSNIKIPVLSVTDSVLPVLKASVKLPINYINDVIFPLLNSTGIDTISNTIIP